VDRYRLQLANLYYGIQQYAKAIEQYERVIEIHKIRNGDLNIRDDEVLMQIAYSYSRLNRYGKAFSFAIKAVNVNPKNEAARDMVYEIWTKGMNPAVNK
jgi:tetratricopeptide (TPR) repeat protein